MSTAEETVVPVAGEEAPENPQPPQIVVGSVVKLKSGGPEMTVDSTGKDEDQGDYANCAWFASSMASEGVAWGDIKEAGFSINALTFVR